MWGIYKGFLPQPSKKIMMVLNMLIGNWEGYLFFFLVFIVRSKSNEGICMSPKQVYFNSFTVIIYGRNL